MVWILENYIFGGKSKGESKFKNKFITKVDLKNCFVLWLSYYCVFGVTPTNISISLEITFPVLLQYY